MYRITRTDGVNLGIVDEVTFIKISKNGCFIPTTEDQAIGVAVNGTPYNLIGHDKINGDTVNVVYVGGSVFVKQAMQATANLDYLCMMTGIDLPYTDEQEDDEMDEEELADE